MQTITSRKEIDRLFAGGRRVSHPALLVLASPSPTYRTNGGVVFVAGKRLGGAVTRNRCKRVLRELARRSDGWAGWDIALIARTATPTAEPGVLDGALGAALSKLGLRS